jgi:GT2 family glycosyltransferase
MEMTRRVHAITIHHRGRDMLDVCLRTLLASTGVDLEIVVVLNGCDEELPEIAHSSPRIHVTTTGDPVGFSAANNIGVGWAESELGAADYYYFVNNDTRSEPDSLALQVAALEADETSAVAGPTLLIDWAPEYLNSLGLNVTDDAWGWDEGIGISLEEYGPLPGRRQVAAVTGSAILVDAAAHDRVGGWTELYDYYFEDIDLCLKIRGAGFGVVHVPDAVVGHHVSATMTLESDYKIYLFHRNRLLLALVHWPPGMLAKMLKFAVVDEILKRPRVESEIKRRALWGALRKLPRALTARWRSRGRDTRWVDFLVPQGSIPVITLPEKPTGAGEDDDPPPVPTHTWDAYARMKTPSPDGKRVLILGCSPLPFENQRMNYAPGARTWQFAEALAADGHAVGVVAMRIPGAYEDGVDGVDQFVEAGVLVTTLEPEIFRRSGVVEAAVGAFRPDVVIGASSTVPALRAAEAAGELPLWVDLFGDLMAEAQARLGVHPDEDLEPYRDVLVSLLERGDAFSAVSDRQRCCVLGQLGLVGRLNRENRGVELVHTVPCSIRQAAGAARSGRSGVDIDDLGDDFVVLWSGGFNTWCDVDTLVDGLELAMAANPAVRFVATGGAIRGHDDLTFDRLQTRVAASEHRDRFAVKGALDADEAAAYRERADLGVVTERNLAERALGSSGRVLEWLGAGLPLVCTDISELGSILAEHDLAGVYRQGDPEDLARVILEAAADPDASRERADRARRYAERHWGVRPSTAPLRRWVRSAVPAADAGRENRLSVARALDDARRLPGVRAELEQERQNFFHVRSELGGIHQSKMWKLWMTYLRIGGLVRFRGRSPGSGSNAASTPDTDDGERR